MSFNIKKYSYKIGSSPKKVTEEVVAIESDIAHAEYEMYTLMSKLENSYELIGISTKFEDGIIKFIDCFNCETRMKIKYRITEEEE